MQADLTGESLVTPTCRGDTPHPHDRQGLRDGKGIGKVTGSEILPAQAARLLDDLTAIVADACALIGTIPPETVIKRIKPDQSPVTAADEASEAAILEGVSRLLPGLPVVSEESADGKQSAGLGESFLIVDPLDGTREFLDGRDEFTVNLAIITHGVPIAGIIAAPKRGRVWRGVVGEGAERLRLLRDGADQAEKIRTRDWPGPGTVAAVSRSHFDSATDAFLASLGSVARNASGSAIKFCQVAEGTADVYPRLAETCEWDVAAGHALVAAAGGVVESPQGRPLTYGRARDFRVPAFVAWGDARKAAKKRT
jgi:3'(2'), 5'-bisphosphate nucleotidase